MSMSDDPELPIMERVRNGDQEAVIILVQRFQGELVGFFYHQCWNQGLAEELAQDVFVNLWRARERWQPTARVRTWLYRIAHNRWIDHCRRDRHHLSLDAISPEGLRLSDRLPAATSQGPTDADEQTRIRTRVQQAVDALPEGQRDVFILANHQGMRYAEISAVLGIPEGTVKSRMHHAVRQLRDDLGDLIA
jgi:RNA polymerase sigma-70 factor (ECF subfamily)